MHATRVDDIIKLITVAPTSFPRISGYDSAIIGVTTALPHRTIYDGEVILKMIKTRKRFRTIQQAGEVFEDTVLKANTGPFAPLIVFMATPGVGRAAKEPDIDPIHAVPESHLPGFSHAVIGVTFAKPHRLIYDAEIILASIRRDNGCTAEEADAIFGKAICEVYVGPLSPVIVYPATLDLSDTAHDTVVN